MNTPAQYNQGGTVVTTGAEDFIFGAGIEEVASRSINRIKYSNGTFTYVIGGQETPCESRSMKFLFVKRRSSYHRVLYTSKFTPGDEEAHLPRCMSNNGTTPVTWAEPIQGVDGQRVVLCGNCPYQKNDAEDTLSYKCMTRQVIYVIPADFPDQVFEFNVPPKGVFAGVDSSGKYRGLNAYVSFSQARLRNMVHPLTNSEAFPGRTINSNLQTVWSYATPTGEAGKNSLGFSLDGGTGRGEDFVNADTLRSAYYVVSDPALLEQFSRPLYRPYEDKPAMVTQQVVDTTPPPPPAKRQPAPAPAPVADEYPDEL